MFSQKPVPMSFFEADPEWLTLKAERDRILNATDPTGFVKAQNALAFRSETLRALYNDNLRRN